MVILGLSVLMFLVAFIVNEVIIGSTSSQYYANLIQREVVKREKNFQQLARDIAAKLRTVAGTMLHAAEDEDVAGFVNNLGRAVDAVDVLEHPSAHHRALVAGGDHVVDICCRWLRCIGGLCGVRRRCRGVGR